MALLSLRLLFILGIINVVGMVCVFLSCRCLVGNSLFNALMKHEWYKKFYNFHCWFWRIFFASVLLHVIVAFLLFGNPF